MYLSPSSPYLKLVIQINLISIVFSAASHRIASKLYSTTSGIYLLEKRCETLKKTSASCGWSRGWLQKDWWVALNGSGDDALENDWRPLVGDIQQFSTLTASFLFPLLILLYTHTLLPPPSLILLRYKQLCMRMSVVVLSLHIFQSVSHSFSRVGSG